MPVRLLRSRRGHCVRLWLLGDDLVLDLVVSGLGNNLPVNQIEFRAIGAASDNLLRIGVADSGQGFELIGGSGVDVELVASGRDLRRCG